jgi:uncharacterized protein
MDFSELYAFNRKSITESGLILPEDGKINLGFFTARVHVPGGADQTECRPDCKGSLPRMRCKIE